MDLSIEASSARGGFGGERYESAPFQIAVRNQFSQLGVAINAAQPGLWVCLDAAGTIDEVHARVRTVVNPRLVEVCNSPIRELWDGAPMRETIESAADSTSAPC